MATRDHPTRPSAPGSSRNSRACWSVTLQHAFAYHQNDLMAMSTAVQGFTPIPEQRYYEKVWLNELATP